VSCILVFDEVEEEFHVFSTNNIATSKEKIKEGFPTTQEGPHS
jgi:hypothetical protein